MKKQKLMRALKVLILIFGVITMAVSIWLITQKAPVIYGEVTHHIAYKPDLTLDVYGPTNALEGRSPVILYFHGGAWVGGTKAIINANRINGAVNELRNNGYSFVCADYSLANDKQSPFPYAIQDAHDVLQWVSENAASFNFDLTNVGVMGESAGAHIAMMMTYADGSLVNRPEKQIQIQYMIDLYGPTDLDGIYNMPALDSIFSLLSKLPLPVQKKLDIKQLLFGFNPEDDSLRAQQFMHQYSPLYYVNEGDPATLIIHGTKDRIVPFDQSVLLEKKLTEFHINHRFIRLSGVDHAFREITDTQKDSVQQEIVNFVFKQYRNHISSVNRQH